MIIDVPWNTHVSDKTSLSASSSLFPYTLYLCVLASPTSCGLTLLLSVSSLLCLPLLLTLSFPFFWRHARSSHDWIHQKTTLHLIGSAPHRLSFPPHFPAPLIFLSLFFWTTRNEAGRWPHEGRTRCAGGQKDKEGNNTNGPTKRMSVMQGSTWHKENAREPHIDICLKTKITRASCRRRAGTAVPRAKQVGDLITADHKMLSEGSESRNRHRYAVVVQDLATQWLQSSPGKTKTSQETQKSLMKFLEPTRKPKVIYTDTSLEFGKACEDLSWNIVRHHTDQKQMGLQKEHCGEWKKGHLRSYCSHVLVTNGGRIPWSVTAICETFKILLSNGKTPYERRLGVLHQFGLKVLPGIFLGSVLHAGGIWKGERHYGRRQWRIGGDGRIRRPRQKA